MVTRAAVWKQRLCQKKTAFKPKVVNRPMKKKRTMKKKGSLKKRGSGVVRPYGIASRQPITPLNKEFLRKHGKVLYHVLLTGAITPEDERAARSYMNSLHKEAVEIDDSLEENTKQVFICQPRKRELMAQYVIVNTALACKGGGPLSNSFIYRYTIELVNNIYSLYTMVEDNWLKQMLRNDSASTFSYELRKVVAIVTREYKPRHAIDSYQQFRCWCLILANNARTIYEQAQSTSCLYAHARIKSLSECMALEMQHPEWLDESLAKNGSTSCYRTVNCFANRLKDTPLQAIKVSEDDTETQALTRCLISHIMGSHERSHKLYSNHSLTLSLTDSWDRSIRYAAFYGQFIPAVFIIQVSHKSCIPSKTIIEQSLHLPSGCPTAENIATAHTEYIPEDMTYIGTSAMRAVYPLLVKGNRIMGEETEVWSKCKPAVYPRDHWDVNRKGGVRLNKLVDVLKRVRNTRVSRRFRYIDNKHAVTKRQL